VIESEQPRAQLASARSNTKLPAAKAGEDYRVALQDEKCRAMYWKVAGGELPKGLKLEGNGLMSGTAAKAGIYRFDLQELSPYRVRPFFEGNVLVKNVELTIE
jgi:hypothetical protein